MIHRLKPYRGKEERKAYRDCTYFGITSEKSLDANGVYREETSFTLSSALSDKQFPIGLHFNASSIELSNSISNAVNALIDKAQSNSNVDATARVYPLFCTGLEYENQCFDIENLIYPENLAIASIARNSSTEFEGNESYLLIPFYIESRFVRLLRAQEDTSILNILETGIFEDAIRTNALCIPLPIVQATA
jgi:hypothetical protein